MTLPPVSRVSALTPNLPHADAAAAARTDLTGGKAGRISTEVLPNGTRLIVAERPGAKKVKVQVGNGAGSLQDPQGKLGLAHYLEHLAFEGSPTRSASEQERIRTEMGGVWNAYTRPQSVVYYGTAPNRDARRAASLLTDMYQHPSTQTRSRRRELAAVKNEMINYASSVADQAWHINQRLLFGDQPLTGNVIGTRKSVSAISPKDLREFHRSYYTGRNTVALVEGDPKHMPLDVIRRELGELEPGARVDNSNLERGFRPGQAVQTITDRTSGNVDLLVSLPVSNQALENTKLPPQFVVSSIANELNDTMRRAHGLTYGVGAGIYEAGAADGHVVEFATTVAPQNARDAVQDLLSTLKDARDGFGPKTFKEHKAQALSRMRMAEPTEQHPTVSEVAEDLFQQALLEPGFPGTESAARPEGKRRGPTAEGKLRAASLKDFSASASQLVDLDNMKLLVRGPAGIQDAIRGGLRDAGIDPRKVQMNPVDLSLYRDMGLGS